MSTLYFFAESITSRSKALRGAPFNLTWCWHFQTECIITLDLSPLTQIISIVKARKLKVQRNKATCAEKTIRYLQTWNWEATSGDSAFGWFIWFCSLHSPDWPPTYNPTSAWLEDKREKPLTYFNTTILPYIKRYLISCLESPARHCNNWEAPQMQQALRELWASEPWSCRCRSEMDAALRHSLTSAVSSGTKQGDRVGHLKEWFVFTVSF